MNPITGFKQMEKFYAPKNKKKKKMLMKSVFWEYAVSAHSWLLFLLTGCMGLIFKRNTDVAILQVTRIEPMVVINMKIG